MHPANAKTAPLTEDAIRAALRDCYDPELPCNIVDLGLVYGVALTLDRDAPGAGIPGVPERYRVAIQLTLTTPGCDAQSHIVAQIENRLAAFERVSRTEVELVWQPAWTAERISPECRNRLGIDGRNQFHLSRKNDLVQLR
jgi:metal-sulfur cluster biosynthetic enzyme